MAAKTLVVGKSGMASTFSAAVSGSSLTLDGPAGRSVLVRLLASNTNQARKLGLKSRVLASANGKFADNGTLSVKLTPSGRAADALKKASRSVKVLYQAVAGDRLVATRVTLKK
jgi:hypothetical protein